MKRAIVWFIIALASCLPAAAGTLTGNLNLPNSSGVTGTLYLSLSQQGEQLTTGSCGGPAALVPTATINITITAGAVTGSPTAIFNDCIAPTQTYYNVQFRDSNNNLLFSTQWSITTAICGSSSTCNIGAIPPVAIPTGQASFGTLYVSNLVLASTCTLNNVTCLGTGATGATGAAGSPGPSCSSTPTAYASGTSYALGVCVISSGVVYISLVASNLGHTPASSPTDWAGLASLNAASQTFTGTNYFSGTTPIEIGNAQKFYSFDASAAAQGLFTLGSDNVFYLYGHPTKQQITFQPNPGTNAFSLFPTYAYFGMQLPGDPSVVASGGSANNYYACWGQNTTFNGTNWIFNTDGVNNGSQMMCSAISNSFTNFYVVPTTGNSIQTISPATLDSSYKRFQINANGIDVYGGIQCAQVAKSSGYTAAASDCGIDVSGTTTITFPHGTIGVHWNIFNTDATNSTTLVADSGNINNTTSVVLLPITGALVFCDGTNCWVDQGGGSGSGAGPVGCGTATGCIAMAESSSSTIVPTSGVDICHANNTLHGIECSVNGGALYAQPQAICHGSLSLGTTTVTSASKTALTATCTGLAVGDNIILDFGADPTGSTGYVPSTNGILTIYKWATTNTINIDVVNNTSSSITPAAVTVYFTGIHYP